MGSLPSPPRLWLGTRGRFTSIWNGPPIYGSSPTRRRFSPSTTKSWCVWTRFSAFLLSEVGPPGSIENEDLANLWMRGGFPRSFLAKSDRQSYEWRVDFVRTFLERDIPQLGSQVPAERLGRFWRMCSHDHGQILNASKLGSALGVSGHTVRSYLELLQKTFMVRLLPTCVINIRKRLVKSPKVYIRDSGMLHALLEIHS